MSALARTSRIRILIACLSLWAGVGTGRAATYYFATDVPASLAGVDYTPDQILVSYGVVYGVQATLDPGATIAGLDRRPDGRWLIAPARPQILGGVDVRPRDVLLFDGSAYSVFLDGEVAGIPSYARIDAILSQGAGDLILSFDVPVNLGGVEYSPADLVLLHAGVFSLYWSAAVAGVPTSANVVGAALDGMGRLLLTFDVPTNLGGTDYLPGQLVAFSGGTFGLYSSDPAWPPSAHLRDFALPPGAGAVPDGGAVVGAPLMIASNGAMLTLSWGTSCAGTDSDYEIYEGSLTTPFTYTHTKMLCSTGGATSATFAQPAGNAYYLVVPRSSVSEGSYGHSTGGAEIPQGTLSCLPQQFLPSCP